MKYSLSYLAEYVNAQVFGSAETEINGVGSIYNAQSGQITFLDDARYRRYLSTTSASAVIVSAAEQAHCNLPMLVCEQPYLAFVRICTLFTQLSRPDAGIHPNAAVDASCTLGTNVAIDAGTHIDAGSIIGNDCIIGANCSVGKDCVLGTGCRLMANVVLGDGTRLGDNVLLHPGAVIGADGFGLVADEDGHWVKIPQCGRVILGDEVEIGANTTIDRGTIEDTVLENDVRVDNQVQIAHNVQIGEHTAIAGCVGIAGSTKIGRRCKIAGGVRIAGHIEICDDVIVSAASVVTKSIRTPGLCRLHSPIYNTQQWIRLKGRVNRIERLVEVKSNTGKGEILS